MSSAFVLRALFCVALTTTLEVYGQTFRVLEGQGPNKFIGNVAQSPELQQIFQNQSIASLKYTIFTKGNPQANLFAIDEATGAVVTNAALDREAICPSNENPCVVQIKVSAHDSGDVVQILNVKIIVDDINDNSPKFSESPVQLLIPESEPIGSTFTFSGASDLDSIGNNSMLSYELITTNVPFDMKIITYPDRTQDVGIIVKTRLDRELIESYQLQIVARDGGIPQKTGSVFVNIAITDFNDNYPEFTRQLYNVTIREDLPVATPVLQVLALDSDSGVNGQVSYRFSSPTQSFVINSTTGSVSVGEGVDFEQKKFYQLMVEASDNGAVPKTAKSLVIVGVSDVNDNAPEMSFNFLSGGDKAQISEHSDLNTFVAYMSVSDKDQGENAETQCQISGNRFILETYKPDEYKVRLNTKLDREIQAEDYVTVVCSDGGRAPMTSTSGFTVVVTDENDNSPAFQQKEYSINVEENTEIGTVLMNISATDKDIGENGRISYRLEGENADKFSVSTLGEVWVNKNIDREDTSTIELTLVAQDNGSPAKSATLPVTINVLDVNDESPVFTKHQYEVSLPEDNVANVEVGRVNATDRDSGLGGQVVYRLASNSADNDLFSISEETGIISTKESLNRESQKVLILNVIAEDRGEPRQSSTVRVLVNLLDVNDNSPDITFPATDNYTINIPHTLPVGSEITIAKAEDTDDGENARLSYVLMEQEKSPKFFDIDEITGVVTLKEKVDVQVSTTFKLYLAVRDHGSPQRETWRNFNIHVSVINDTTRVSDAESGKHNLIIVITVIVLTAILSAIILVTIFIIRRRDKKLNGPDDVIDARPDLYDKPVTRKTEAKNPNVGEIVRGDKLYDVQSAPIGNGNVSAGSGSTYEAPLQSSSPKEQPPFTISGVENSSVEQKHLQYIRDYFPQDSGFDLSGISFSDNNSFKNQKHDSRKSRHEQVLVSQPRIPSSMKQPINNNNNITTADGHRRSSRKQPNSSRKPSRPNRVQWADADAIPPSWSTDCADSDFYPQVLSDNGEFPRKHDDTTSDLSGDTETGDSGRGGSDDDIHRGYGLQIENEGIHGHYV